MNFVTLVPDQAATFCDARHIPMDLERRNLIPHMTQAHKKAGIVTASAFMVFIAIAANRPVGSDSAHQTQSTTRSHDTSRGQSTDDIAQSLQRDLGVIAARNR
jgi:hypothetical protein